jgi:hypothetical protein
MEYLHDHVDDDVEMMWNVLYKNLHLHLGFVQDYKKIQTLTKKNFLERFTYEVAKLFFEK